MIKELTISTIVIIVITTLSIISQNYTEKSVQTIEEGLYELKDLLQQTIDKEVLQDKMSDIINIWNKKNNTLAYYIEHDELEKVETELTSLKANIELQEKEESISSIERSIFILNHIKDKTKLEIKNVF